MTERPRRRQHIETASAGPDGMAATTGSQHSYLEATHDLSPLFTGQLGLLLDAMPDGVVIADETGHIRHVNGQTEALFGYPREGLLGQPVEGLLPERFRGSHPAHRARYGANPHIRPMGTGLQLYGLRRDGTEFPVEISLSPVEGDGDVLVIATIRDVTEQRRLERRAREEAEGRLAMLQAVLEELPSGVYLARGRDARLVLANRQVADIWGAAWPEGLPMVAFLAASGARAADLNGRELAPDELATVKALATGRSVRQQQEVIHRPDGSTLPVLVNAVPLDPAVLPYLSGALTRLEGPEPLVLVVHHDVTALKEAERLKDEFIALAAHELRNPVASLVGYAEMLAQPAGRGKRAIPRAWREEAAGAVLEASSRLAALTDDLLDATRLQANRLTLLPEPTELGALVRRVVRRQQVATTRHTIELAIPPDPVVVGADVRRLEQVLTNLLSNAIKYSPDGGTIEVSVDVHEAGQAGGADVDGDAGPLRTARVAVRDHGIGIPASQQTGIFGRFARAENARQSAIPGTGLGLYLCRELVERQGGRIWFASVEGAGTTFTFELPVWAEPARD